MINKLFAERYLLGRRILSAKPFLNFLMQVCILLAASLNLPAQFSAQLSAQTSGEPKWEFFRGNNFDGHSSEIGIANGWPAEGPPVLWTRELGQGYSGFTGVGDRIFTQYQTVTSQFVICLDANTGETIWEHRYGWSYETVGLYPGPRSTPTLDGGHGGLLFYTSPSGVLGCLNQSDGKPVWEVDLMATFDAKPVGFGYACSPVIVGEKLLLPVGGAGSAVVAFNKLDGSVIWKSGDSPISYASLLPIKRGERQLLAAFLKNSLAVLDLQSGKFLQEIKLSNGYDEHSAWPIYSEPYLWFAAPFREGSRLIEVTDTDPPQLVDVYRRDLLSNDVCSSVLVNGQLYGFDIYDVQSKIHRPSRGSFRCVDFENGKSRWENGSPTERHAHDPSQGTAAADSVGHSSVIYADGKLILFNDTGDLILLKSNPDRFEALARIRVLGGEICWTQPMLLNKRLYLRNQSRAVCLYLGEPDQLDSVGNAIQSVADIPQGSNFDLANYVFSVEPEFAMDAPTMRWMVNWFWVMLILGWAIAFPVAVGVSIVFKQSVAVRRTLFRVIAVLLGLFGTNLVSKWMDDFVFTWPLILSTVFGIVVFQMKTKKEVKSARAQDSECNPASSPNGTGLGSDSAASNKGAADSRLNLWPGRLALLLFFATCAAYFFLCRHLSLAFEWSFLVGFPGAIPFLMLARKFGGQTSKASVFLEWILTAVAFAAFYWIGVAMIVLRYWVG